MVFYFCFLTKENNVTEKIFAENCVALTYMTLGNNFVRFPTAFQLCCLLEAKVLNCPHHSWRGRKPAPLQLEQSKGLVSLSVLIKVISDLGLWSFEMLISIEGTLPI